MKEIFGQTTESGKKPEAPKGAESIAKKQADELLAQLSYLSETAPLPGVEEETERIKNELLKILKDEVRFDGNDVRRLRSQIEQISEDHVVERIVDAEGEKIERWRHKYYDAEGRYLATAIVDLEAEDVTTVGRVVGQDKAGKGRRLKNFMLYGKKKGKLTELDVLELANRHEVEIIVANEPLENYHYGDKERQATVPPLRSPLDIATFLHELGHADQYYDHGFARVAPLYGMSKSYGVSHGEIRDTTTVRRAAEETIEAVPEAAEIMSKEDREEAYSRLEALSAKRKENIDFSLKLDRKKGRLLREKDAALREFVSGSFNVLSPAELLRQIEVARDAIDAATDPEEAHRSAVQDFISKLEMVGFRFNSKERPPSAPPAAKTGGRIFNVDEAPAEEVSPQVYTEDVGDIHVIKSLVERVVNKLNLDDTEIEFADENKMIVKFRAPVAGEMRIVVLELNVPAGARADYEQKLAGKDFELEEVRRAIGEKDAERDVIENNFSTELNNSGLREIIALPTRKMERDATARAFHWAIKIRDRVGLDLFKKLAIPSAPQDEDTCEGSVVAGVRRRWRDKKSLTAREDLKSAAETYGAGGIPHRPIKKHKP